MVALIWRKPPQLGQGFARQGQTLLDILPAGGVEVIGEGGESTGMLGNKRVVEHIALLLSSCSSALAILSAPPRRRPVLCSSRSSDRRRAPGRHLITFCGWQNASAPVHGGLKTIIGAAADSSCRVPIIRGWLLRLWPMRSQLGLVKIVEDGALPMPIDWRAHADS